MVSRVRQVVRAMAHKDIVGELSRKGLQIQVARHILSFLDFKNLVKASMVSLDWHRTVTQGNLFRNLFYRNLESDPFWRCIYNRKQNEEVGDDRDDRFYNRLCFDIWESAVKTTNNWISGHCLGTISNLDVARHPRGETIFELSMDEKHFVGLRGCIEQEFVVFDRWTRQLKKKILTKCNYTHFQMMRGILIACEDKSVDVWDVDSGEKVHKFEDSPMFAERIKNASVDEGAFKMHLSECSHFLVTCAYFNYKYRTDEGKFHFGILTLRRMKTRETIQRVFEENEMQHIDNVFVDRYYVIANINTRDKTTIHVRSTATLDVVHSIVFEKHSCLVGYSLGLFAMATQLTVYRRIDMFQAESGNCAKTFLLPSGCGPLYLNDRFIFTISEISINIYDILKIGPALYPLILDPVSSFFSICYIPRCFRNNKIIFFDQSQIYALNPDPDVMLITCIDFDVHRL